MTAKYNCAECEDPIQGEPFPLERVYVAIGNRPKYWSLCEKHYQRLTFKQKLDYAKP